MTTIGEKIMRVRKLRKWTRQELAHRSKVSESTLCRIELHQAGNIKTLRRICNALGINFTIEPEK